MAGIDGPVLGIEGAEALQVRPSSPTTFHKLRGCMYFDEEKAFDTYVVLDEQEEGVHLLEGEVQVLEQKGQAGVRREVGAR